jgi:hypothetical protein
LGLREELSYKYLKGKGIEIGALAWPLQVSDLACVMYVDRFTRSELQVLYKSFEIAKSRGTLSWY